MAVVMTYGGTTFTATRDPMMGGYSTVRQWKNPSIRTAGGKLYVYEKTVAYDIKTLTWSAIDPTDLTNLLAFLTAVNWSAHSFSFTDPEGEHFLAQYFGPPRLEWTPADLTERDLTIELFIHAHRYHLVNGAGNNIVNGAGNCITAPLNV